MTQPKARAVWIARDETADADYVLLESDEPPQAVRGYYLGASETIDSSTFERVYGYTLNPGECKRVRIRIEEVK